MMMATSSLAFCYFVTIGNDSLGTSKEWRNILYFFQGPVSGEIMIYLFQGPTTSSESIVTVPDQETEIVNVVIVI
jgi:hypothetical protein